MKSAVFKRIFLQTALILGVSTAIALGTNAIRTDGIPVIASTPYDIFAPCKDSEIQVQAASVPQASSEETLYVDARGKDAFDAEHAVRAVNVPYSALFGATDENIERLKGIVAKSSPSAILVYGMVDDPAAPGSKVDFAAPLAKQLVEVGLKNVAQIPGGLDALKKKNLKTVKDHE